MDSGKIYKIVSDSTDKIYIGSTVKTLEERLEGHENQYEKWFYTNLKSKLYCTSFEILKYGNYQIVLLEDYPCCCTRELLKREGIYQIKEFNKCVNSLIAGGRPRTTKIDDNDFYTCYCGKKMINNYKIRYKHIKSSTHKKKIKEIHLDMIQSNPKYEVSISYV
jgi:hypothetical protein